jgi:RimJ/RimL family protein N-acetyltransferase
MDRIIETKRLVLRPFRNDDAADIVAKINTYEIASKLARVPFPYALSDAETFLGWVSEAKVKTRYSAICLKDGSDTLQGAISYEWNDEKADAEFGYWLVKPLWGQGIMTEAAHAMVDHAFTVAGLDRLKSCYFDENPASGIVLRRAGFEVVKPCMQFSKAQNREVPVTLMEMSRARWLNAKHEGELISHHVKT